MDDDGGTDYSTIQDAVNAANASDIIRVFDGTYHENVVVDKAVTIQGNGSGVTTIDGGANGSVIRINSDNVMISGFTLTNSKSGHNAGIFTTNSNVTVIDCISEENNGYGMYFGSCRDIVVSGCIIRRNGHVGLYFQEVDDSSVLNTSSTFNRLYGFWHQGNRNLIVDTMVSHTVEGPGIKIIGIGYHNNTFIRCEIADNGEDGVTMDDADNTTFLDCRISNNKYNGMLINGEDHPNTINNCTISGNEYNGIYLMNVRLMTIVNCLISTNIERGIELDDCSGNLFYGNFFDNNTANAHDDETNNWDNGSTGGGEPVV